MNLATVTVREESDIRSKADFILGTTDRNATDIDYRMCD